jgi:cytochrome c-type biogenesis protein CcmH
VILFWVICAGLLAIALAFLLPTLFDKSVNAKESSDLERKEANIAVYRDQLIELKADLQNGIVSQEQFDQDKEEIERRLLEDVNAKARVSKGGPPASRNTAYALALLIPLTAVIFYVKVGTPNGIDSVATVAPETPAMAGPGGQRTQAQIEANVQKLADKLKANPSDPAGWIMLARSYSSMERYGEATGAYAKATELNPKDPDLWAEYAFATAMAGDRKLEGRPTELINQALKIDPDNLKALQLAGTAAFDAKDYKKAIEIWQRVLSKAPPGSEGAKAIADRINEAKKLAGSN